jgi:hypothetical protein
MTSVKSAVESYGIAYDPDLVPPLDLMRGEGIDVLEEWFRWGEEWSMLLRIYGCITGQSNVLEIGCGLGRIAFPLRYVLSSEGSYDGFEICKPKVEFLSSEPFTRSTATSDSSGPTFTIRITTPKDRSRPRIIASRTTTILSMWCTLRPCSRTCSPKRPSTISVKRRACSNLADARF